MHGSKVFSFFTVHYKIFFLIFGLFAVLSIAFSNEKQGWIWNLWILPYWLLFIGGFYCLVNFGYYASEAEEKKWLNGIKKKLLSNNVKKSTSLAGYGNFTGEKLYLERLIFVCMQLSVGAIPSRF